MGSVETSIRAKRYEIADLCRTFRVRRLDVFGSAAGGRLRPDSDVDVLVEFDTTSPGFDAFGAYFGLKEGLERLLGRPVDVVDASAIRNPYFRAEVQATKEPLYAAA